MGYNMSNIIVNLKKEIAEAGGGGSSELDSRVTALETVVGDETGGLVKDVDDLGTVVGDETGGLVKDVDDLQSEFESLPENAYSETEVIVGKWGGDDLYRKLVTLGALPNSATKSFNIGVTTETVRRIEVYYSNSSGYGPLPNNDVGVEFNKSTKKLDISSSSDYSSYTGTCILEYTKSTTRNLKGGNK